MITSVPDEALIDPLFSRRLELKFQTHATLFYAEYDASERATRYGWEWNKGHDEGCENAVDWQIVYEEGLRCGILMSF